MGLNWKSNTTKILGAIGLTTLISGVSVGATLMVTWNGTDKLNEVKEMALAYVGDTSGTISNLETFITEKEQEVKDITYELELAQGNMNAMEQEYQNQIEELQAQIGGLQANGSMKDREIEELQAQIKELENTYSGSSSRSEVEEMRANYESQIADLQAQLEEIDVTLTDAINGKNQYEDLYLKEQVKYNNLYMSYNSSRSEVLELQNRITELEQQLEQLQSSSSQMGDVASQLEQANADVTQFYEEMKAIFSR